MAGSLADMATTHGSVRAQRTSSNGHSRSSSSNRSSTSGSTPNHEPEPRHNPDSLPHAPLPGSQEDEGESITALTSTHHHHHHHRSNRYTHYDSDGHRLPAGFVRVGYDADRSVYTFRDGAGDLWEGQSGNEYGRLHRVGDSVAPERLEAVWAPPLTDKGDDNENTVEQPMTVFPDTWDPPEDHETDELPTAKWFQAKAKGKLGFSSLRQSILGRSSGGRRTNHHHHPVSTSTTAASSHGEKFGGGDTPSERRSDEIVRNSSLGGWSEASTFVYDAPARSRAQTVAMPAKVWS